MASGAKPKRSASNPKADRPWHLGLPDWTQVALRSWQSTTSYHLRLISAGVAFFGFLALLPSLTVLVLAYSLLADPRAIANDTLAISSFLPPGVAQLIADQLLRIIQASGRDRGLGLLLALAVALWGARKAALAVIDALNAAYHEEEQRPALTVNLLAMTIMLGAIVLGGFAMISIMLLYYAERVVSGMTGAGGIVITIVGHLLLGAAVAAVIATLYRYGPCRKAARWSWLSPGSFFAAAAWLVLTLLFSLYVTNFGRYDEVYGSLGAVVVLQLWMYMSSFLLVFGALLNAELEQQTVADTTAGKKRPIGKRGAYAADHVVKGKGRRQRAE